jgi:K+-sensing histidine kinase KdpD
MEYRSYNLMKFRIMDRSPVPVWIERHEGPIKKIGLFCTNISPNRRAPKAAVKLKKAFNAKLSAYYVNDPVKNENKVEPSEITKQYRIKWNDITKEKVDRFIYQKAREENFDLIILGRIKKRGYFHLRSKFAKKTGCSVLLVN